MTNKGGAVDLTGGIRAERERLQAHVAKLTEEIAKYNAADRELEKAEQALAKLDLNGVQVAAPATPSGRRPQGQAREEIVAHLQKVGTTRGTNRLARTLGVTQATAYAAVKALEEDGLVKLTISDSPGHPMVIEWVGGAEVPAITTKRTARQRKDAERKAAYRAEQRKQQPEKPKKARNNSVPHLPPGEAERRIRAYLKEHRRVEGLNKLAEGSGVPLGSVSHNLVKIERAGEVRIERQGPTQPIIIHAVELDENKNNGVASAQTATV